MSGLHRGEMCSHGAYYNEVPELKTKLAMMTEALLEIRDRWIPTLRRDAREADKTDCNAGSIAFLLARVVPLHAYPVPAKKCECYAKDGYNGGPCSCAPGPSTPAAEGRLVRALAWAENRCSPHAFAEALAAEVRRLEKQEVTLKADRDDWRVRASGYADMRARAQKAEADLGASRASHIISGNRVKELEGTLEEIIRRCAAQNVTIVGLTIHIDLHELRDFARAAIGRRP